MSYRQPKLAKFTGTAWFSRLESASVTWCDARFAKLEQDAAWLIRYGDEVLSFCSASAAQRGILRRGVPVVTCTRTETVVYGFNGELAARLNALAQALNNEGWTNAVLQRTTPVAEPRPGPVSLRRGSARMAWDPAHATPPSAPEMPELLAEACPVPVMVRTLFRMEMAWASQAADDEKVKGMATAARWPQAQTDTYRVMHINGDASPYMDQALERSDHVLAARLSVQYYRNPNAKRFKLPG
jgi:hypothetical protein